MMDWLSRHEGSVFRAAVLGLTALGLAGVQTFLTHCNRPAAPIVIGPLLAPTGPAVTETPTPGPITIYVTGCVNRPGVYVLPWSSRAEQAVAAAGGPTEEADLVRVNLAERLVDAQQIYVPGRHEQEMPVLPTPRVETTMMGPPSADSPICINSASAEQLELLPGIGPVLAQRIIEYRELHGPFASCEDLLDVRGIGEVTFAHIRDLVRVD
jgi:competence protein ComEA